MTVPFVEEVARRVPVLFRAREERGALCAWITLDTVRERVEKRRTSPVDEDDEDDDEDDPEDEEEEVDGVEEELEGVDEDEGTGEG